jgi:hypothetical protein
MGQRGRDSEAEQRRQYGGYSEAEIDAALVRSQRSDPLGVAIRLATLGAVYWLLARAIKDGLTAPFVVLPLLLELLVVFWGGQLLKRVVDCKAFRQSAGGLPLTLAWTVGIGLLILGMLSWDSATGQPDPARLPQALSAAQASIVEHGLHWALLAMFGGLLFGTIHDLSYWKRHGGVFVWTAITATGFRLAVLFLLGFVGVIVGTVLGEFVLMQLSHSGWLPLLRAQGWAWPVWAFLLLLDVGVVVLATLMHRDLSAQAAGSKPKRERRSRLPG